MVNVSSINSMEDLMALVDQLGPLSGPIEFMQMLQQMDQFSGGNGMQAIMNSPMMGEIMQKLQQRQIDHFTKLYGMGGAQGAIQQQAFGLHQLQNQQVVLLKHHGTYGMSQHIKQIMHKVGLKVTHN